MKGQLYTPSLELSGLTIETGETLHFAFRGETITEMLKDYSLEEVEAILVKWQAIFEDGRCQQIYAGPSIERKEILPLLPNCKTLEKVAQ
jgi:hypothetical protein